MEADMTSSDEHRVQFDFEIEFTNGGGVQGQAFRLDIPGSDVSDDWIAAAIVLDLRLLMVREVRIRNRQVLREPHKRGVVTAAAAGEWPMAAAAGTRIVDLAHPIEAGMTTYPGLPVPEIQPFLEREASAAHYAPGVTFAIDLITLCGNTGTYLDSPFHRYADGIDLAGLPPERLLDLPAVRVDVTGSGTRAVDAAALLPYELGGRAVLVHTGFDRHWRTEAYLRDHPFLTAAAVDLLVEAGAALVGIDSLNIDDTADLARPAHSGLLGAGIPIVEHMTNLGAVPVEGARFSAIPAPIRGTGTFPVRALAMILA
jgi:arylformamidase